MYVCVYARIQPEGCEEIPNSRICKFVVKFFYVTVLKGFTIYSARSNDKYFA